MPLLQRALAKRRCPLRYGVPVSWYSWFASSWMSKPCDWLAPYGMIALSKKLKLPRPETPWRLRRFATGLPKLGSSSSTAIASLRFIGLTEIDGKESRLPPMSLDKPFFEDPDKSRCMEWRDGFSRLRRDIGLSASAASLNEVSWP
jgi:hypothetical protein